MLPSISDLHSRLVPTMVGVTLKSDVLHKLHGYCTRLFPHLHTANLKDMDVRPNAAGYAHLVDGRGYRRVISRLTSQFDSASTRMIADVLYAE